MFFLFCSRFLKEVKGLVWLICMITDWVTKQTSVATSQRRCGSLPFFEDKPMLEGLKKKKIPCLVVNHQENGFKDDCSMAFHRGFT